MGAEAVRKGATHFGKPAARGARDSDLGSRSAPLDLLGTPASGFDSSRLQRRAERVEVEGISLAVADLHDLIAMKKAAGRPKDLIEVEILSALLEERAASG